MRPDKKRLTYLLQKYLHNTISDEEADELFKFIREARQDEVLKEQIIDVFSQAHAEEDTGVMDWDAMFFRITGKTEKWKNKSTRKIVIWKRVAAAVLILVIGSLGVYVLRDKGVQQQPAQELVEKVDPLPGGNKAVLTLGNGKRVVLDSSNNGLLSMQGSTKVIKSNGGQLKYSRGQSAAGSQPSGEVQKKIFYNTITVPRGGQYKVVLPDGSKVWLNSASSLRFPTAFAGAKREIEMTGEAYFEITQNKDQPFKVQVRGIAVNVLGTHFNVNAYADEAEIKTTLLEGAVKVGDKILRPGEQAVKKKGEKIIVKEVNVGDAVAWKNGFFTFNRATFQEVMKKLSRWYDIEVDFEAGAPSKQRFSGKIGRDLTLSQVLEGLKLTKASFRIEKDGKVIILP